MMLLWSKFENSISWMLDLTKISGICISYLCWGCWEQLNYQPKVQWKLLSRGKLPFLSRTSAPKLTKSYPFLRPLPNLRMKLEIHSSQNKSSTEDSKKSGHKLARSCFDSLLSSLEQDYNTESGFLVGVESMGGIIMLYKVDHILRNKNLITNL